MQKTRTSLLIVLASLLLSACGLIPDVVLEPDALGYDNASITTTPFQNAELDSTSLSSLSSVASGSFDPITFEDTTTTIPISPQVFEIVQGIKDGVTVTPPLSGAFPTTITITNITLNISLSDAEDAITIPITFNGNLVLEQSTCLASCQYTFAAGSLEAAATSLNVNISGSQFRTVRSIITRGGDNTVELDMSITTESTPELVGATMQLTMDVQSNTVKF